MIKRVPQMRGPLVVVDLEAAVQIAEQALAKRPAGTTNSAWISLALYRDHLRGRLARMRAPLRLDKDGNPVAVRRHEAGENAKRLTEFRFLRG